MFNLGTAYYHGDGVPINDIAALAWFLLAEEHGSEPGKDAVAREKGAMQPWQVASAFESVGDVYEQGKLLPQDHKLAIDWYRKAAQDGDPGMQVKFANYLLQQSDPSKYPEALESCEAGAKKYYGPAALCAGLLHQRGIGTTPNVQEAARWFTRSAELGNSQAMYQLAKMYWTGTGVKQERVTAYAFLLLAANDRIADAVHDQDTYEHNLTPKQMDKARKQAESWARQHHALEFRERPPATDPASKEPAAKVPRKSL
jgi:TPR repeat protein